MTRTLLAFGDSHTAGAEIENEYEYECFEKAYPALIAKHYGFNYENYAYPGGSNDWSVKQFLQVIQYKLKENNSLFVLFNITESARTFFICPDEDYTSPLHYYPQHLTYDRTSSSSVDLFGKEFQDYGNKILKYLPFYKHYLRTNNLNQKTLDQIFLIQSICQNYDIPFLFHTSFSWEFGDWSLISKKNFYGHQYNFYTNDESNKRAEMYSFWASAHNNPFWKKVVNKKRWKGHYPKEYHVYWSKKLITFIEEQKILEGYN